MKMNKSTRIYRFFRLRITSQNGTEHPEKRGIPNRVMPMLLISLATLFGPLYAQAANHFVRQGATGSANGNDWTNAYKSLPANLVRGDTYYIAAGDYPAYTFDDSLSGTSVITVKKATISDHGQNTGWRAAYGGGQAVFDSILTFKTGNYIFDGQTRNESNWFDGASYGFQVYHNGTELQNIIIGATSSQAASNVTIKHVYINAPYKTVSTTRKIKQYAVDTNTWGGGSPHTGLLFTRMYVRGSNNVWFLRNTNGAIVEYSASEGAKSTSANHGEVVNLYYTGANAIIRYNQWRDEYIGYGGTALVAIADPNNETAHGLSFYGNTVWDFEVGNAAVGFGGRFLSNNNKVYNNTFIRGVGFNSGTAWGDGTNNLVYNNLYINCKTVRHDGHSDYNGYSDSNTHSESHAQINIPTSIFTNYSGNDFTLKSGTIAGMTLSSPYKTDLRGITRGTDGTWDRGAFEYGGQASVQPPSNLRVQ
ncbi:MAG: hypothetical protein GQ529_02760 [Methyloprofundus sp.]|nr:hypothetical protein [Methyloprofundus sp.]